MQDRALAYLKTQASKPLSAAELMAALAVPPAEADRFVAQLENMVENGALVRTPVGTYAASVRMGMVTGWLKVHPQGPAVLISDDESDPDQEWVVPAGALGGAWDGDRILARVQAEAGSDGTPGEAAVVRVLSRFAQRLVGTFSGNRSGGWVLPDASETMTEVWIPGGRTRGARAGEKVLVQVDPAAPDQRPPAGRVVERLGPAGDAATERLALSRRFGLVTEFSPQAQAEAEQVARQAVGGGRGAAGDNETAAGARRSVAPDLPELPDLPGPAGERTDWRDLPLVTLPDPLRLPPHSGGDASLGAVELPQMAFGVERTARGGWRLRVAALDLTAWVREGSELDREGRRRGAAVALGGGSLPLWPPALLQAVALTPGALRPALGCEVLLDRQGNPTQTRMVPVWIRSRGHLTDDAFAALVAGAGEKDLRPVARGLADLAQRLLRRRRERGGLPLDPTDQSPAGATGVAAELVVLAGEAMARWADRRRLPIPFRVQPEATPERLADLVAFLQHLGVAVSPADPGEWPALMATLQAARDDEATGPILRAALERTLPAAAYAQRPGPHVGLGVEVYCHWTAPAHRYADLRTQRVLLAAARAKGKLALRLLGRRRRELAALVQELNQQESRAAAAETADAQQQAALALARQVGQPVTAVVVGVAPGGLRVWLPGGIQGDVPVENLVDDFYHYDDRTPALVGEGTGRRYRIGDLVTLRLHQAQPKRRQFVFMIEPTQEPAGKAPAETPRPRARRRRRRSGGSPGAAEQPTAAQQSQRPVNGRTSRRKAEGRGERPERPAPQAAPQAASEPIAHAAPQPERQPEPQPAAEQPSRRRVVAVDMWGVPIPRGRRRETVDTPAPAGTIYSVAPVERPRRTENRSRPTRPTRPNRSNRPASRPDEVAVQQGEQSTKNGRVEAASAAEVIPGAGVDAAPRNARTGSKTGSRRRRRTPSRRTAE